MLLNYPDESGAGGLRLVPDAARSLPTVSEDGRTYTFTIRPGMRFSPPSNQPVTAQTFKHTIERSLSPYLPTGNRPDRCSSAMSSARPPTSPERPATSPGVAGARRPADDSPYAARAGPAGPARNPRCSAPSRPTRPSGPFPARSPPQVPTTSLQRTPWTRLRPAPQSQLPRRSPASAAADRGHRRRATPARADRGVEVRLRDWRASPPGKAARLERLYGARSAAARAGGSASSSAPRSQSTTST